MKKDVTVVLIDDDIDDTTLLIESFSNYHSLAITTFDKPSLFFEFIEQHDCSNICLLVVDLNLPEESGIEVLRKLKLKPQFTDVPMLVFTTGGTPAEVKYCEEQKIELFKKPSNIAGWESFAFVMAAHCDPRMARNTA